MRTTLSFSAWFYSQWEVHEGDVVLTMFNSVTQVCEIQNVEQDKVDALTTTIASVCKKTIEDISIYNNCSSSNFLNETPPKIVVDDCICCNETKPICNSSQFAMCYFLHHTLFVFKFKLYCRKK